MPFSWFAGLPVYEDEDAIYPPASYLMLWPLLGWLTLDQARWLWALTSMVAMIWLMILIVRESEARGPERLFIALLVPSIYATGATIGNGQLILHLLPPLITGILLIRRKVTWLHDLLITLCFLVALAKPAVAAPFLWILLFYPKSFSRNASYIRNNENACSKAPAAELHFQGRLDRKSVV